MKDIILWPYFVALIVAGMCCLGISTAIGYLSDAAASAYTQKSMSLGVKVEPQKEEVDCNVKDSHIYQFGGSDICFKVSCARGANAGNPAELENMPFHVYRVDCGLMTKQNGLIILANIVLSVDDYYLATKGTAE